MSLVEDFMGQSINSIATTTAQGGDYAQHDSITTAYLDAQHTNFGSGNDVTFGPGAIYDRPLINYVEYIRSGDGKYLTRANSGVVGYRDGYLTSGGLPSEPYRQFASLALHYLFTSDAATLAALGDQADYAYYKTIGDGYLVSTSGTSNSARQQAHALEALIAAVYVGAPNDGFAIPGLPAGYNHTTALHALVDGILASMAADGGHRFQNDSFYTLIYQQGLLDEALIHYYFLYADSTRKAAIIAALKKREEFRWTQMLDTFNNPSSALGPSFYYIEGPNTFDPSNFEPYSPVGKPDLCSWHVGAYGFLYNVTADPTYRTRGLQLLHTSFFGDHANVDSGPNGAYLATIGNTPSASTAGVMHKVLSEITRTSWRAMYYFLNTPAVTHSGVPINTVLPVITQPTPGNLTCSAGTWSNSPTNTIYSWCRRPDAGGVNVVMQTGINPNYGAQASDVGSRLFCLQTPSNGVGAGIIARAAESAVITTVGTPTTGGGDPKKIRGKWRNN